MSMVGPTPDPGQRNLLAPFILSANLLHPATTLGDVDKICADAMRYQFGAVYTTSYFIENVARQLRETPEVDAVCAVGFPLGIVMPNVVAHETQAAVRAGANRIAVVMNPSLVNGDLWAWIERDIHDVVQAAMSRPVTVIIEIGYFPSSQRWVRALRVAQQAGAAAVQLCTGFHADMATTRETRIARDAIGKDVELLAHSTLTSASDVWKLMGAGATGIVTNKGIQLMDPGDRF